MIESPEVYTISFDLSYDAGKSLQRRGRDLSLGHPILSQTRWHEPVK